MILLIIIKDTRKLYYTTTQHGNLIELFIMYEIMMYVMVYTDVNYGCVAHIWYEGVFYNHVDNILKILLNIYF